VGQHTLNRLCLCKHKKKRCTSFSGSACTIYLSSIFCLIHAANLRLSRLPAIILMAFSFWLPRGLPATSWAFIQHSYGRWRVKWRHMGINAGGQEEVGSMECSSRRQH